MITIEERRARWREKSRRYYVEHYDDVRVRDNARHRAKYVAHPRQPRDCSVRDCSVCGTSFRRRRQPNGQWSGRRTCSETCRRRALSTSMSKHRPDGFGRSCPIRVESCRQCGRMFTAHGATRICSAACRRDRLREQSREWQRRTRETAIRYWQIGKTPEARALAETYYELRQALMYRRHTDRSDCYGPEYRHD